MQKSSFKLENRLLSKGYELIIGIDEAGRGPLAGPVVACATTVRNSKFLISNFQTNPKSKIQNPKNSRLQVTGCGLWDLIRDSKTLSHKQRENLYDFIHEHFYVGVGICDHKTIDRMNILQATFLAMKKAVSDLIRNPNKEHNLLCHSCEGRNTEKSISGSRIKYGMTNCRCVVLVDGNKKIPNFSMEQKFIVNGDKLVKSISAASIIAKVTRDWIMIEMHKKYPHYHFHKHKGYGTKLHMKMLEKHGPCKIHRRSFKPVKKLARKKR